MLYLLRNIRHKLLTNDQSLDHYRLNFEGFSMRQYLTQIYPNSVMDEPALPKSNKAILSSQVYENLAITIYGQSRRVSNEFYPQYKYDLITMIAMLDQELTKP